MATEQLSWAAISEIAEKVYSKPYDPEVEGPLNIPAHDGIGKCSYDQPWGELNVCPHHIDKNPRPRPTGIADSALDFVGNTPMVRLSRLSKICGVNDDVEIIAKCENYSAGGSVKDRIAMRMLEDAERSGRILPGDVLIEATSGNTGCGLCMAACIKGYKVIITMPMKMSGEKLNMMKALGAVIYRTPTEAGWQDDNSHIALAIRLQKAIPRSHILDQYLNPGNPLAHYDYTAEEILAQTNGELDYMVCTAGTGGTLTGISRKLKEKCPNIKVIGVDPQGSILALPENLNDEDKLQAYQVEGIGYDFIPSVLDRSAADHWVKTRDEESFKYARSLIKHEGIMVGGSAGSAMAGAMKAIEQLNITKGRVCVLFADSTRNYMSKFLDDAWMEEKGFDKTTF